MRKCIRYFLGAALLLAISSPLGCGGGQAPTNQPQPPSPQPPGPQPPNPPEPSGPTPEEIERLNKAAREAAFQMVRQCHAKIGEQVLKTDAIVRSAILGTKCLDDAKMQQFEKDFTAISFAIDSFAKEFDKAPETDVSESLLKQAKDKVSALLADYQAAQGYLSYCRTKTILDGVKPTEQLAGNMGHNLFLVALGDIFGAGTGFEGNHSHVTVGHRLNALKVIKQQTAGKVFIKDDDQAHPCRGLDIPSSNDAGPPHPDFSQELLSKLITQSDNALLLLQAFEGSIEGLRNEVEKQISKLNKGESLFLPFSWTEHAFAFEITRETDAQTPSYTFRIFNSGAGIDTYHASAHTGYKIQYFPHLEVVEVPHANLVSPVLLKALQEVTHPQAQKSDPSTLYEQVLKIIGGKPNPKPYGMSAFRDAQESGSCSYFSLPWVFDSAIERIMASDKSAQKGSLAARIEFLIGAITLKGYAARLAEKGTHTADERQIQLLKKGLNFFSSQTLQSHADGTLDDGDLGVLGENGETIRKDVKLAEEIIRNKLYTATPYSIAQIILEKNGSSTAAPILREIEKAQGDVESGTITFDFSKYTPSESGTKLLEELTDFHKRFLLAMRATRYIEVITGISELVLRLPLEKDNYWPKVIGKDVTSELLISLLRKIEAVYVFSLLQAIATQNTKEKQISTKDFLVALKLLALSDNLNQHFSNIKPAIPSMNQPHFNWILSENSALAEIKEPRWQEELKKVRGYFDTPAKISFFGLHNIPAGTGDRVPGEPRTRHTFHDPSAIRELDPTQLHWTSVQTWPDLEWTLNYMKQQAGYDAWKKKRLEVSEKAHEGKREEHVFPWEWKLGYYDKSLNPDVKPRKPESRLLVEFDRREASMLLAGDAGASQEQFPNGDRLPTTFYDLRAQSYLTDFLLTGRIDVNSAKKLNFRKDLSIGRLNDLKGFSVDTGLKQPIVVRRTKLVCTHYDEDNRCTQQESVTTNEPDAVAITKSTGFRLSKFVFSVFDQDTESPFYTDQEKIEVTRDPTKVIYTRPYFHAQTAFEPFAQYSTDFGPNVKFQHDEIARIYMSGATKTGAPDLQIEQERRHLLPNNLIIHDPSTEGIAKLTLERVRSVFTLSGNIELQITETLALFDKFPSLLLRPEYQRLFIKLMFYPGLLEREYTVSPDQSKRFTERLIDFCTRQYSLFERRGNLKAMAFMLQLNQLFKDNWDYALTLKKTKTPPNYTPAFLNTPQRLLELARALPAERAQQKSFLYRNVLESYLNAQTLSDVDIEQLLFAAIEHRVLAISDANFDDPFMEAQVRHITAQKLPIMREVLFDDSKLNARGQDILARLLKRLRPDLSLSSAFVARPLKESGTLFRTVRGNAVLDMLLPSVLEAKATGPAGATTVQIDIAVGSFYDAGQNSIPFPLSATEYEKQFGKEKHPEKVTQIGFQTYEWVGESGRSYRAKRNAASVWTFQMYFGDQWYQFVPDRDIALDVQGFFPGFDHWQSTGPSKQQSFLIFDRSNKTLAYRTTANCVDNTPRDCTVEKVVRESDKAVLAFLKDTTYPVSVFSQLEMPTYIYVWQLADNPGRISDVALPRLGLTFKPLANDPDRLDCAGMQAGTNKLYKVAAIQYSAQLHNPVNYLVCDEVGAQVPTRIAISPIENFELLKAEEAKRKVGTLAQTAFKPQRKLSATNVLATGTSGVKLAIYKLPALKDGIEADGVIEATSDAARLYLALRYLWQLEYRRAKSLIDEVTRSDRKLSKEKGEIGILIWILQGRPDKDPRANAVSLLAGTNLLKQDRYFGAQLEYLSMTITDAYVRYLATISSLTPDWISFFDEYLIANAFSERSEIQQRLKVLKAMYPNSKLPIPQTVLARVLPIALPTAVISPPDTLTSFMVFSQVLKDKSKAAGVSKEVINACSFIANVNFDVLHDIAAGHPYNEPLARNWLSELISPSVVANLSGSQLRDEWIKVFHLNTTTSCNVLASILFLTSQLKDKSGIPTAKEIRQQFELQNQLNKKSAELQERIHDTKTRINNLNYPEKQIWDKASRTYINNPNYEAGVAKYWKERDRLEAEIAQLEKEYANTVERFMAISKEMERRFLNRVSSQPYQEQVFRPVIEGNQVPLKNPIPLGIKEPDETFGQTFDVGTTDAVDGLKEPLLAANSNVFALDPLTEQEKLTIQADIESLKRELDKGQGGPSQVVQGIKTLQSNLDKYRDKLLAESTRERLLKPAAIASLLKDIRDKLALEIKNRDKLAKDALALARKESTLLSQASYQRVISLVDTHDTRAIDELTQLLATNKLKALYKATQGNLKLDEVKQLYTLLYKILLSSTYINHATAYEQALISLNSLIARAISQKSELFTSAVKAVVTIGRQQRSYSAQSHIEYLMLEQYMGFLLRKEQVDSLDALRLKDGSYNRKSLGAVIELIMGSGKTAVLLPLLSVWNSQDEWLNIIMLPESLVASMSQQLSLQLSKGFGRAVDVIEISRSTPLGESELKVLYDRLVRAQFENRTIVTTNSAVQSLFLSFIAALHEFAKGNKTYEKPITEFVKIFQFLRSKGRLTIDEVDLALDILQSHQFSIKPRVELNTTLTSTVYSFYRFLAAHPLGIRLAFIAGSKGEALSQGSYNRVRQKLIESIARDENFFNDAAPLDKLYRFYISDPQRQQLLINYFNTDRMSDRSTLFADIEKTLDARGQSAIDALKNAVAVLYEEINNVFLLTASKKLQIHYGPMPTPVRDRENDETEEAFAVRLREFRDTGFLSIPYHAGNPVVTSRFGTAIEALNYTMQMHLEQKSYLRQIQLELNDLKKLAEKDDESTVRIFTTRFDLLRKGTKISVYDVDDDMVKGWASRIAFGGEPELEFSLIRRYVLPQVKAYAIQLQTNAQIYESLFNSVQGFSGTLWSVDTFPDVFKQPLLSDTAEKTFYLLWSQYQQRKKEDPGYKSIGTHRREHLMTEYDWRFEGSDIDDGGLFRGIDNYLIAKKKMNSSGSSVIFYDKDNNIVVLQPGDSVTPIEQPQVPTQNRLAYWDKKHTTGSDLKLVADMRARLTFDYHTLSRDIQQSTWRLRGLDKGQSIEKYLVIDEDLQIITQRLKDVLGISISDFELGDLLLYSVVNQELRLSDLLFRSTKHKMKNAVIKEVLNQMFSGKYDPRGLVEMYGAVRTLFETSLLDNPYLVNGFPKTALPKAFALQKEREKAVGAAIATALKDTRFYSPNTLPILEKSIEDIIRRDDPKLPLTINVAAVDEGLEVEVETELEDEQEQEEETEKEVEPFKFDPQFKPHPVLKWPFSSQEAAFRPDYFRGLVPSQWTTRDDSQPPLVTLQDALEKGRLARLKSMVSPDILMSLNYAPLHYKHSLATPEKTSYEFDFYNLYYKNLTNILIIVDRNNNIQMVMIDNNDAAQFDSFLRLDQDSTTDLSTRNHRIGLYSLEQGIFRTGLEPIEMSELEGNPQFVEMLTQIKFLNGELEYNNNELSYLRDWIKKNNVEQMYNLFVLDILKYKQDSREALNSSSIGYLFESLRTEE